MAIDSLKLLVENLRESDFVSIVTYAGYAEVVLEQTPGNQKQTIIDVLDSLEANGSTNGNGGIELAYDLVYDNFVFGGNNRVIMATDGDFNVGTTSGTELANMVQEKSEIGIYLTILSFGGSTWAMEQMEDLSNKGQGNYYFIDNLNEANKVLNVDISSTIVAIAEDVKIQIEFNDEIIASYRLIGYENRLLSNDDFDDDTVDAGEIGAGHTVTAFYEVSYIEGYSEGDLATVRVRYKDIGGEESKLIEGNVNTLEHTTTPSTDFLFAQSIVEVSLLFRDSEYKGTASYDHALSIIENNLGDDPYSLRLEFYNLVMELKEIDTVN
jgi:Ca-activated chloride channel family protein